MAAEKKSTKKTVEVDEATVAELNRSGKRRISTTGKADQIDRSDGPLSGGPDAQVRVRDGR